MFAMKPSAIRAKVVSLAGRRTDEISGSWETPSSCSETAPGTRAISKGPSKRPASTSARRTTSAKSWIGFDHLPATRSDLRQSAGPNPGHRARAQ